MSEEFPSQDPLEAARIIASDEYQQQKAAEDAQQVRLGEWMDGSQENADDVAAYLESRPYNDAGGTPRNPDNKAFINPDTYFDARRTQIAREEGFKTAGEYAYDDMSVPELAYKLAQAEHTEDRTIQESIQSELDERLDELDGSYTQVKGIDAKVTELKDRELERLRGEDSGSRKERFTRARRIGRSLLRNFAIISDEARGNYEEDETAELPTSQAAVTQEPQSAEPEPATAVSEDEPEPEEDDDVTPAVEDDATAEPKNDDDVQPTEKGFKAAVRRHLRDYPIKDTPPKPEGYEHPLDKFDRKYTLPAKARVNQRAAEFGGSVKQAGERAGEWSPFLRRAGHIGQVIVNRVVALPEQWDEYLRHLDEE